MTIRRRPSAAVVFAACVLAACSGAPATESAPPQTGSQVGTASRPPENTSLLPQGIWEAQLSVEDLSAAGASPGSVDPGRYRWTFDETRVRISLDGDRATCDGDAEPAATATAGAVMVTWHMTFGCGGSDTVRWTLDAAGLHLTLVESTGDYAATKAILEAKPYQPVDGDPTLSWSDAWTTCENPDGGACLGELERGTYTTDVFETPLTYTVPDGWANYEDLPGNVLLLPAGAALGGAGAGTADYIGLYDGVAVASEDCAEQPQAGLGTTPGTIASWFTDLDGVDATQPEPVSLGGLEGLVLDLRLAEGHTDVCPYPGYEGVPMVPMLTGDGTGPATFHHVINGAITTRLYLLAGPLDRTIAIEVSDSSGGTDLAELDAVVQTFEFGNPGQ